MPESLEIQHVAVTGATGFIGMHLLRALHAAGARISAIVEIGKRPERLDTLGFDVDRILVDSPSEMAAAIRGLRPDYVIHLSAFISTARNLEAVELSLLRNVLPTVSLLTAASEVGVRRVILMGSCEEYGRDSSPFNPAAASDPSSPYGASKAAITAYARMFTNALKLPTVVLRPSVVYGPGQSPRMLISQVMQAIAHRRPIDVTEGKQTRDFVFVSDVVDVILLALTRPGIDGDAWNVGSGEVVVVRETLELIEQITGTSGLIEYGKRPYIDREIFSYELAVDDTYAAFDWQPCVRLEDGLRRTWEHISNNL